MAEPGGGERGNWEMGERINWGSDAEVFEVLDDSSERSVLKVFNPEKEERARREEKTAVELSGDPNGVIVKLKAAGEQVVIDGETRACLMLERIEGETLLDVIRKDQHLKTLKEIVEFWKPVAQTLDWARAKGWVFTDFNFEALMRDNQGRARLIDLSGFAKVGSHSGLFTNQFADRNMINARGGAVNQRSDFYGVTGLIYALITGAGPGDTELVSIGKTRVEVSEEQKKAITKVLNRARGHGGIFASRQSSASKIIEELRMLN